MTKEDGVARGAMEWRERAKARLNILLSGYHEILAGVSATHRQTGGPWSHRTMAHGGNQWCRPTAGLSRSLYSILKP